MALTEVAICDRALRRCGIGDPLESTDGTVANITTTGLAATLCQRVFAEAFQFVLELYPWPFAQRYANLSQLTPTETAHTGEWSYAYTYPTDCARLWRFARATSPPAGTERCARWLMECLTAEDPRYSYAIYSVDDDRVILAHLDSDEARMIYVRNDPNLTDVSETFAQALALRVAECVSYPMTQGPDLANQVRAELYQLMLPLAAGLAMNEQGLQARQDGRWLNARRGW